MWMDRTRLALVLLAALGSWSVALSTARQDRGDALSESGEVGRVLDREGTATRKGASGRRSDLLERGSALMPGDRIEVGARGANALKVQATGGAEWTLGPGTQVEAGDRASLELVRGDVLLVPSPGETLTVRGPRGSQRRVAERSVLRVRSDELEALETDPAWLVGYEANASTEALGSLLANVDGRDVPLSIRYHKVTVDVRDQIARTVIEEAFVNHTSEVLEGVFYFPLPADASISGFGMWVGDELVQGDIVEKERAREIYETILREKRDPGLLEWTGGNLFKARVYPIVGEKRVRIAYTQVLPKDGDGFGYRYALQSEMLQKTPLERLEIEVNVASKVPIASAACLSHSARVRTSQHAARVEFSAQEYTPDRDFQMRVDFAPREERLTFIPHRRGDDGYFMLLIDAPQGVASAVDEPVDLLVLADTSGSLHGAPRAGQLAFLEALLGALGPEDSFNLATCDVETRWAFDGSRPANRQAVAEALEHFEARDALGWSDLSQAFRSAAERATDRTHVVYLGDGVPTSGEADPAAVADELGRLVGPGTFHAVVPGTSSELIVLRALARRGGGSVRSIGAGRDAAQTAFALRNELSAPTVQNLELAFEGVSVAAVYPEVLPNLPNGGQHVVVGRFDPGSDSSGSVRLTGTQEGRRLEFRGDLELDASDEGNSFVPRLWARSRLDDLLEEGRNPKIRERILALSEDFQIVTPYSSFLVLESDADRQRFGVRKQFRMRDGEAFFSEGRAAAQHELVRDQMQAAKAWRTEWRERLIDSLADWGREWTEHLRSLDRHVALAEGDAFFLGKGVRSRKALASPQELRASAEPSEAFEEESSPEEGWRQDDDWDDGEDVSLEEEAFFDEAAGPASPPVSSRAVSRLEALGYSGNAADLGPEGSASRYGGGSFDPFEALFPPLARPRSGALEREDLQAWLDVFDRRSALARSDSGWRIDVESVRVDHRGRSQRSEQTTWVANETWLHRSEHRAGEIYTLDWRRGEERGVLREGWRLGRTRVSEDGDGLAYAAPFAWYFGDRIRSLEDHELSIEEASDGRVVIVGTLALQPDREIELSVDPQRRVVLQVTHRQAGRRTHGTRFSEFEEIGGMWWPAVVTELGPEGESERGETVRRIEVKVRPRAELDSQVDAQLARLEDAILLVEEAPSLTESKQAVADGNAELAHRWVLMKEAARRQSDVAPERFDAFMRVVDGRAGAAAVQLAWLAQARQQERRRLRILELARELVATPREAEYGLVTQLAADSHTFGGSESLEVLEVLEPVYARQPEQLEARLALVRARLSVLAGMNAHAAFFEAYEQAAGDWPFDASLQTTFATLRAQRDGVESGRAWLSRSEAEHGPWTTGELRSFRSTIGQILWNGYRLEELASWSASENASRPELLDHGALGLWLSALVYLDRDGEAWRLAQDWVRLADVDERPPGAADKLAAAVSHALGQGPNLYQQRLDDERAETLAAWVRALIGRERDAHLVSTVLTHWRFRQSEAGQRLIQERFRALEAGVESWPAEQVLQHVSWLRHVDFELGGAEPDWASVFQEALARWRSATEERERQVWSQVVLGHAERELRVQLLRERFERLAESSKERAGAAAALFAELLQADWSAEVEDELATLVGALVGDASPGLEARLDTQVLALHDLADWVVRERTRAVLERDPEFESWTRRTLAARRAAEKRTSYGHALALVENTITRLAEPVRPWGLAERVVWSARLKRNRTETWERAIELLSASVQELVDTGSVRALDALPDEARRAVRRRELFARRSIAACVRLTLAFGEDERSERVAELRGVLEQLAAGDVEVPDGREAIRDLLVVIDAGDELEAFLQSEFGEGKRFAGMRWGGDYGRVLAERGRLDEATRVFERVAALDELSAEDWRLLSDWYTALDRREDSLEALRDSFEASSADELAAALHGAVAYDDLGVPVELDPSVPDQLVALMRKSPYPERHVRLLNQIYGPTKDHRVLGCLPHAVIGHSAGSIYPVLEQIGSLAGMIDEEATVDRVRTQLAEARRADLDAVDRRALWLLEFQVILRAARQSHGTERHAEQALAALRSAFQEDWQPFEPALMASFLAGQGNLQPTVLAEEQVRQLRELARLARAGEQRFLVEESLATLLWSYGARDEAMRRMEAALDAERQVNDGRLPSGRIAALKTLSGWMVSAGEFRGAERAWRREIAAGHPSDGEGRLRLELHRVGFAALSAGAALEAGAGVGLYEHLVSTIESELDERTHENHARQLVDQLADVWELAHKRLRSNESGVREDASRFAFSQLPGVLAAYQYRRGQQMVGRIARALSLVGGPRLELEFLIGRAENEPAWLRLVGQEFWRQHAWRLGDALQRESGTLEPTLAQRALTLVLTELRGDLETGQAANRAIYDVRDRRFWSAHKEDFLRATLGYLESGPSARRVAYASDYLFHGLGARVEAIDALKPLWRAGRLPWDLRDQLAGYLLVTERWEELRAIAAGLVEDRPREARLWVLAMRAHHGLGDAGGTLRSFEAAERALRAAGAWKERAIAELAEGCLQTALWAEAVRLFEDAIALHVRTAPRRGVGGGTLSMYYRQLATTRARLGQTSEAVDAAAGAIVSWGNDREQRQQDLDVLRAVLAASEDLAGYVDSLDREVERTGLENAIVRKALGRVYLDQGDAGRAAQQLERAIEVQPNDAESHGLLVEALDRAERIQAAVDAQLAWARYAQRDWGLWERLGGRLAAAGVEDRAERAYTMLAELSPNESEGHQALAGVRERQGRWRDAVQHWQHVTRVRSNEPAGHLSLAAAQIESGDLSGARSTLEHLETHDWPAATPDLHKAIQNLRQRLD